MTSADDQWDDWRRDNQAVLGSGDYTPRDLFCAGWAAALSAALGGDETAEVTQRYASDPEWRWLSSTRWLQRTAYGHDTDAPVTDEQRAIDAVHQGFALIMELAEAFGELQWKEWAANRGDVDRDALVGELVDVAHFLANLLVKFGVNDDEWEHLYREKQARNLARQQHGYSARAVKCPDCGRELDKPGAAKVVSGQRGDFIICAHCGERLGQCSGGAVTWRAGLDGDIITWLEP